MKDLVISGKVIRRELFILLGCLLAAVGVNIYSIIRFKTPFYEVFTQIGYTLIAMVTILFAVSLIRVIVFILKRVFEGK